MKLRYFGYLIREENSQEKISHNIKPIIDSYCLYGNSSLKKSFKRFDSNLYITKIEFHENLYFFIKTNSSEIIKKINTHNFSVGDIASQLSKDESLGFASYIYLSPNDPIIGIANSSISPRFDALSDYFNHLFTKIGQSQYTVEMTALCERSKKKNLLEMDMINSVYIDIDANKGIGKLISEQLFTSDHKGLGKLKIKVEGTNNIKESFTKMVNKFIDDKGKYLDNQGIECIGARAKENEFQGQLMDYYLDNENTLSDNLNPRAKTKTLPEQIDEKILENKKLKQLYKKYFDQNKPTVKTIDHLKQFHEVKAFVKALSSANSSFSQEITEEEKIEG